MHNCALKVVKITTLFQSTQEKYAFFAIFSLRIFALIVYFFDFQQFVKIHFNKIFYHFKRIFLATTQFSALLGGKERIAALSTPHLLGPTLVFLDHPFCFLGLMVVVCLLGLVVLFLRLSFLLLKLAFRLTHGF